MILGIDSLKRVFLGEGDGPICNRGKRVIWGKFLRTMTVSFIFASLIPRTVTRTDSKSTTMFHGLMNGSMNKRSTEWVAVLGCL